MKFLPFSPLHLLLVQILKIFLQKQTKRTKDVSSTHFQIQSKGIQHLLPKPRALAPSFPPLASVQILKIHHARFAFIRGSNLFPLSHLAPMATSGRPRRCSPYRLLDSSALCGFAASREKTNVRRSRGQDAPWTDPPSPRLRTGMLGLQVPATICGA